MSLVNHLKNIGLEDKEARVYVAMLELGSSTVLEIATKAEVTRPTAYVVIDALKKIGLVNTETRGKKQYFVAESPEQIKINLDREQKLIELRKGEFNEVFPELKKLFEKDRVINNADNKLSEANLILEQFSANPESVSREQLAETLRKLLN